MWLNCGGRRSSSGVGFCFPFALDTVLFVEVYYIIVIGGIRDAMLVVLDGVVKRGIWGERVYPTWL